MEARSAGAALLPTLSRARSSAASMREQSSALSFAEVACAASSCRSMRAAVSRKAASKPSMRDAPCADRVLPPCVASAEVNCRSTASRRALRVAISTARRPCSSRSISCKVSLWESCSSRSPTAASRRLRSIVVSDSWSWRASARPRTTSSKRPRMSATAPSALVTCSTCSSDRARPTSASPRKASNSRRRAAAVEAAVEAAALASCAASRAARAAALAPSPPWTRSVSARSPLCSKSCFWTSRATSPCKRRVASSIWELMRSKAAFSRFQTSCMHIWNHRSRSLFRSSSGTKRCREARSPLGAAADATEPGWGSSSAAAMQAPGLSAPRSTK
mmetsp:Transcript_64462/g.138255  ORF Transcript_64462/g.138255 Transcript_64462/m.138255 type:complete len:333 (+) Transcript_64462:163-1161(+)